MFFSSDRHRESLCVLLAVLNLAEGRSSLVCIVPLGVHWNRQRNITKTRKDHLDIGDLLSRAMAFVAFSEHVERYREAAIETQSYPRRFHAASTLA